MSDAGPPTGCNGHGELPDEFRAVVLGAVDRITPVLERLQAQQSMTTSDPVTSDLSSSTGAGPAAAGCGDADSAQAPSAGATPSTPCAVCPVCAVIAAWRGERSELVARVVDHAAGLVAVLRAALDEGAGAPARGDGSAPASRPPSGRTVHHISVHR